MSTSLQTLARQGYNHVPISRRVLADMDTPLSVYRRIAAEPYSYLLESVEGGERWGRYSIIGLSAREVVKVCGHQVEVVHDGSVVESLQHDNPLAFVREYAKRYRVPVNDTSRFVGGLVGYFGYDTVRFVEPRLAHSAPPTTTLAAPDIFLMVSHELVVFDNLKGEMRLLVYVDPSDGDAERIAHTRLDEIVARLRCPNDTQHEHFGLAVHEKDFSSEYGREEFLTAVEKIKRYILDGDVMQVVLAQRMNVPLRAAAIDVYRALRHLNPSPYMYYMNLGDFEVVGSSPEILVRVENRTVITRPLAGTRPRGQTREEDLALERELLGDPKEIAEHLMLIDLSRNDVGRVAEIGSVAVTERMTIERYSHVMHISSNVEGRLKEGKDALDVLCATLPVGTLSGAPKIRAMEIIDELEPCRRGIYGGAVGYLSWNGNMDTAIAIRTAVIKNQHLYVQAGCGVVADSVPEREWEETLNKGRAIFSAVRMAENGLLLTE